MIISTGKLAKMMDVHRNTALARMRELRSLYGDEVVRKRGKGYCISSEDLRRLMPELASDRGLEADIADLRRDVAELRKCVQIQARRLSHMERFSRND